MDVWRDARLVHERLAYVPSEANLWPSLTGAEVLRFLGQLHGSVDTAYRDELVRRFELVLDKKIRAYSHGNRQKVLLIAAFASRADVLLLDEPTTGLDPLMEQVFRACVREAGDRGQTVLLSSHILSEVEAVCDRVAMLRAGRIIETGRLEVLRGLAAVRVRAELDGPPPDLAAIAGVTNVVVDGRTVECDVSGPMEPLLRALDGRGRPPHDDPGAVAGGALHVPLRRRRVAAERGRPMTTAVATPTEPHHRAAGPGVRVEAAIARRAFRQVWKGATVWAVAFGATVAATALSYVNSFPDQASRDQLAASTSGDAGVSILLGPISAIDTVGGYTVYKCFVFLTTIGAIWGLLAATRLLRGEEDAGRWSLVLAGAHARPSGDRGDAGRAGRRGRASCSAAPRSAPCSWRPTPTSASGSASPSSSRSSIAVAPAVFVAVGALTSQLGRTRRVATTLGMVVFGVAFVIRMLADSGSSTRWLLWLSPFGWIERMRPLTDNDPRPLVLAAVTVVVLVAASVALAAGRDVGAGDARVPRRGPAPQVRPRFAVGAGRPTRAARARGLVRRGGRCGLRVRDHREGGDRRRALVDQ